MTSGQNPPNDPGDRTNEVDDVDIGPGALLAEKSDAVCRMGSLMLTSGTGSYRVKAAMGRVAQALGIDQIEAQVSLNEIVATTRPHGTFRTQVVEVPAPVVNADRLGALMRISLRASAGLTAATLQHQLDRVEQRRPLYPTGLVIAAAAGACAAFAFLNNGRWQECVAAGIAAAAGKCVQLALSRVRLNQLAIVAVAACAACLVYVLSAEVLRWALPDAAEPLHAAAFTSAILFLVPGFPLLTAGIDLARFDFTSGMSRLLYAAMITLACGMGAWLIAWAFGLVPTEIPAPDLSWWSLAGLRILASYLGVLGFAVTFNTPIRVALWCSGIGAVANLGRLSAIDAGANPLLCATLATTAVGLMAAWASQRVLSARITLSVPAVLIMVPGASAFRALIAMINHDPLSALANGLTSLSVVVCLAAGLAIARMVSDPAWISANPSWTQMPRTHAQQALRAHLQQPPQDDAE